jgi:archaellum component FlaC
MGSILGLLMIFQHPEIFLIILVIFILFLLMLRKKALPPDTMADRHEPLAEISKDKELLSSIDTGLSPGVSMNRVKLLAELSGAKEHLYRMDEKIHSTESLIAMAVEDNALSEQSLEEFEQDIDQVRKVRNELATVIKKYESVLGIKDTAVCFNSSETITVSSSHSSAG